MGTKRLESTLSAIMPAMIGYRRELPTVNGERIAALAIEQVRKGGAVLLLLLRIAVAYLNVLSLLSRRKLFRNLEREGQEKLIYGSIEGRLMAARGLVVLVRSILSFHYYSQDAVCLAVGFDRAELCADADKHQVIVDRGACGR